MGHVLDAYAIVALGADEPAAQAVEDILRTGDAAVTSVNLAEAIDVLVRVHGLGEARVTGLVEPLVLGGHVAVLAPGALQASRAARLRIAHYERRSRPLSMADCFLLAAAGPEDRIATADPAVAHVARAEGIELVPLPDSAGRRP